jgi:hypothetical protein
LINIVGVIVSLAAVWFLSLVTVHVLANAWGTRMRHLASRSETASAETTMEQRSYSTHTTPCFATATCLRDSIGVGRTTQVVSFVGWAVCGILGTAVLAFGLFGRVGIAGVVVGGVSASVVGAMAGFLASSFVEHTKRAWQEAAHP